MQRKTVDDEAMSLTRQKRLGSGAQVEELALERNTNILSIVTGGKAEYRGAVTNKSVDVMLGACGSSLMIFRKIESMIIS